MATLSNDSQGSLDYIGIFDAKLVQRVPGGTEGAVARALTAGPNEGSTVYEKQYSCVTGMITGGGVTVKDFGGKKVKEIQIKLDDNIMLQLPFNMLKNIAQPLPNVDASKQVKISVYRNKRGRAGIAISQDGVNCEWHYTREHPNGLPSPVKDDLGEWDYRDHDRFLATRVNEFFESLTPDQNANPFNNESAYRQPDEPVVFSDTPAGYDDEPPVGDDDIPFGA